LNEKMFHENVMKIGLKRLQTTKLEDKLKQKNSTSPNELFNMLNDKIQNSIIKSKLANTLKDKISTNLILKINHKTEL